ncbi:class II aldolase/adducin family protein [Streptomyces sp. NPDC017868]|uniref:class II aldolase/adducin family protein n=1 Tax=Streptomyces sp. NPDC017868 TaxID=3365014 RepID=UPI0037BCDCEF
MNAGVDPVRRQVSDLHQELVRYGLVVRTAGDVSARVPGEDLLVIKPNGVSYDELTPRIMIVRDLDGTVVEGDHAPSSDTAAHAYAYRHLPEVGGVVHTHSTCARAARGENVARTVHLSRRFGEPLPIAQADVDSPDFRYRNVYGRPRPGEEPPHEEAAGRPPGPVPDRWTS